ncbi:MAG: PBP1A family penicillin-binding protein [Fimbriimonadaceae bacterium]|nr:PBP1A family penicillin-binding protein [Fimbriimonadaceae bacterium]
MRTLLIGLLTACGVGIWSGHYAFEQGYAQLEAIRAELPKVDEPGSFRPPLKTRVVAADGTLLAELWRENRELVPLEQIPRHLINATIATEDQRFRQHIGVSPRDMLRAVVANYQAGEAVQGASTITQQLARELYLSRRRQVRRKIAEALLAIELERRYSKDEILELYLNQVNYGKGLYGVRTAAAGYFGKEPRALTLAECAALAAVPARPTSFHLFTDRAGATVRRDRVLREMQVQGYLTAPQRQAAAAQPLRVKTWQPPDFRPRRAPYYTTHAIREAITQVGEEAVYAGGLTITLELDLRLQATAEEAVADAVANNRGRGVSQGAGVLIDVRDGAVLALVGGLDWNRSQFNRATQAKRQPGSAFKLFVYTAAVDRGFRPTDRLHDGPLTIPDGRKPWRPTNYDHRWHGDVTLQTALAQSINIPAVKLLQRLGPEVVIGYAQRLGITTPLRSVPSLALGTSEVTLLELTAAYGAFPAGGARLLPRCVRRIVDQTGRALYEPRIEPQAVLTPSTVTTMLGMLQEVMRSGTGRPAALTEALCGGKTGTTQDGRDAWFIGFTPAYVGGVWLGNDAYRPMRGIYGGTDCGPAWRRLMRAAVTQRGCPRAFSEPHWASGGDPRDSRSLGYQIEITAESRRAEAQVCATTDLLATPYCPHRVKRSFEPGLAPTASCPLHQAPPASVPPPRPEPLRRPTVPPEPPASSAPEAGPAAPASPVPEPPDAPLTEQFVICPDSGRLARPGCPRPQTVVLDPLAAPTEECPLH